MTNLCSKFEHRARDGEAREDEVRSGTDALAWDGEAGSDNADG